MNGTRRVVFIDIVEKERDYILEDHNHAKKRN
jgi:hypothetical protein